MNPKVSQVNRTGFTLVELLVTITVLAIVAGAVTPLLTSMKATSDQRDAMSAIRRITAQAREIAIRTGTTTDIIFDESTRELQIEEQQDSGTPNVILRVAVPSGIDPQRFQVERRDVAASDFKLTFAPDGHSNGGGIEFNEFAISVDQNGSYTFLDGPLPDEEDRIWQAGDLEQRP